MGMSLGSLQELVMDRETCFFSPWGHKESDMAEQLNSNYNFSSVQSLSHV